MGTANVNSKPIFLNARARAGAAALLLAGCGAPPPPKSLSGLWSTSLAACKAGLGVTFNRHAVRARFAQETIVLLAAPRYAVRGAGPERRIEIEYRLPQGAGGVAAGAGRGVLVLARTPEGRLRAVSARFTDVRTGSARLSLTPGRLEQTFDLARCPDAQPAR